MVVFFLIGTTVFVVALKNETVNRDRLFMVFTCTVSLSLLLSASATSANLLGWDIHQEYNRFLQVSAEGVWQPGIQQNYNAVLSITILPSILSTVTAIDGFQVFKFIFPLLFSLVPLVLYMSYRKLLNAESAFIGVFLFMAYPIYYIELIALARQEVAELLLVLLLWVFLSNKIRRRTSGRLLILLLTFGIVTAHYSLAIIYLVIIGFSTASAFILRKDVALSSRATFLISLIFLIIWYGYATSGSVLFSLLSFILAVKEGLAFDFFSAAARPVVAPTTLESLHFTNAALQYLVQLILVLGLLVYIRKGKNEAEKKIFPLVIAGFALVGSSVILPFFSEGLNFGRTYHIALMLIAPCFAFGIQSMETVSRRVLSYLGIHVNVVRSRTLGKTRVIAVLILFSYFLFSSGWVYAAGMSRPSSFILDSRAMMDSSDASLKAYYFSYATVDQDVVSAQWLRSHFVNDGLLCADWISRSQVLTSYGGFPTELSFPLKCEGYLSALKAGDGRWPISNGTTYVYLSVLNARYGLFTEWGTSNLYEIIRLPHTGVIIMENKIYSDGGSIYV